MHYHEVLVLFTLRIIEGKNPSGQCVELERTCRAWPQLCHANVELERISLCYGIRKNSVGQKWMHVVSQDPAWRGASCSLCAGSCGVGQHPGFSACILASCHTAAQSAVLCVLTWQMDP